MSDNEKNRVFSVPMCGFSCKCKRNIHMDQEENYVICIANEKRNFIKSVNLHFSFPSLGTGKS